MSQKIVSKKEDVVVKKIARVELRMQVSGHPRNGHIERNPRVQDAFPGAEVPSVYECLLPAVGEKLKLPQPPTPGSSASEVREFERALEEGIRGIFTHVVGKQGNNEGTWTLLPDPMFTLGGAPDWKTGHSAIAFELGVQPEDLGLKVTGAPRTYRVDYKNGVVAKCWVCFHVA